MTISAFSNGSPKLPVSSPPSELQRLIQNKLLTPVFQPIVDVGSNNIVGYESLIRGPEDSALAWPDQLFAAAASSRQLAALEYACREAACEAFVRLNLSGRLFLNMTPLSFTDSQYRDGVTMAILRRLQLDPQRVVFELTEKQPLDDYELLSDACEHFKRQGFSVAIDDLGAGYAGLRIWSELSADYVKIDRHFISGIDASAVKREFVRAMMDIAGRIGNKVIAEGVETEEEFKTLVAMGVEYLQGYYVARPAAEPVHEAPPHLQAARGAGMPLSYDTFRRTLVEVVMTERTLPPDILAAEVVKIFRSNVALSCLPVVAGDRALGMISRSELLNVFSWRYSYELHGHKPIADFISPLSTFLDVKCEINVAGKLITEDPEQNMSVDILVCEGERYVGVAKVRSILRSITDEKLRAARHSNPLTGLPGNVPLYEWIDQLLCQKNEFVAAYCDINKFKPFNDAFGYTSGDEVIILLGQLLRAQVDPEVDFVGHVGGDDFVVVFRSADWRKRCDGLLQAFASAAGELLSTDQQEYWVEDREGQRCRFGPLTLSVGCVRPDHGECSTHHQVAMLLADAKHSAKALGGNRIFMSRRKGPEQSLV